MGLWSYIKKHEIWSKVVASLLVAVILAIAAALAIKFGFDWSKAITWTEGAATQCWEATVATFKYPVPLWLVLAGLGCVYLLSRFRAFLNSAPEVGPQVQPAAENSIEYAGMLWRYHLGRDGVPHNIIPFCPVCDLQIQPRWAYTGLGTRLMQYYCERCQREVAQTQRLDELLNLVAREVQRAERQKEKSPAG